MGKDYVIPLELSSIDGLSITAAFKAINTSGFSFPCVRLRIINLTYTQLLISYDKYYSHEFLDARCEIDIDFQANNAPTNCISMFEKGTIVYVKQGVGIPKGHSVKLIAYGSN